MPRPVRRLGLAGGAVAVAAFVAGSGVAPAESSASTAPPTTPAAPGMDVGGAIGTALPGLGGLLVLVAGGGILGYRRADAGSRARSDAARAPRAH